MKTKTTLQIVIGTILIAAIVGVWEYFAQSSTDLWLILPAPSEIGYTLITRFDRIWFHAIVTFEEMIGSLIFAIVAAVPLVWSMRQFRPIGGTIQTLFILFQSIPAFCLSPLLVMWFGWSSTTIILPTALMMLFPVTLSIYKGLYAAPTRLIEYFKMHKATSFQLFFKLQLPFALPYFFSGLRIALAMSGVGAIAGEWAGADRGLGVLMVESRQAMDFEMTFAALFTLVILTIALYLIGIICEKRCWPMYRVISSFFTVKVLHTIAFIFISSSLILSCQKASPTPKEPQKDKIHLVLDWLPNPNHVPFFVGDKLGFFAEEGFNLRLTKADSLDPLQPLAAKQVDLVVSYFPRTVCAIAKGSQFKVIAKLIHQPLDCVVVLHDSLIQTPSDLSGKIIGLSDSHFTSSFLSTLTDGFTVVPPKKQNVNFDLSTALISKNVDAIYGAFWNIEPQQMDSCGIATRYFPVTDFGVPTYDELVVVAVSNTKYTTGQFVRRFQRALQRCIDYCKNNPKEAFELYLTAHPDKGEKVRAWEEKAWNATLPTLAASQQFSDENISQLVTWLHQKGIIEETPNSADIICRP